MVCGKGPVPLAPSGLSRRLVCVVRFVQGAGPRGVRGIGAQFFASWSLCDDAVMRSPLVLDPLVGESFSSWIDRTALELEVSRRRLWEAIELTDSTHAPVGYGIDLLPHQKEVTVERFDVDPLALDAMLLRSYMGTCLDFDTFTLERPEEIPSWTKRNWVSPHYSRACPRCLEKNPGKWLLAWKVPWSFICVEHGVYLLGSCPTCAQPFQSIDFDERQGRVCCGNVPDSSPRSSSGHVRSRFGNALCGSVIADAATIKVADEELLELQRKLNAFLAPPDGVDRSDARRVFSELKSMVRLAAHIGVPSSLSTADEPVRSRFDEYVEYREMSLKKRERRLTPLLGDPLLFAGVVRIAAPLVFADADQACRDFVLAVHSEPGEDAGTWAKAGHGSWSPPARIAPSLRRAREFQRISASTRFSLRRPLGASSFVDCGLHLVTWRNVPQLFWEQLTDEAAAEFFEGAFRDNVRSFLSQCLARHLSPELESFVQVADALGSAPVSRSWLHRTNIAMGGEFLQGLALVADRLKAEPNPIDYQARREALANYADIAEADWDNICKSSGVEYLPRFTVARRKRAACWVWETLTGGDFRLAPALGIEQLAGRPRTNAVYLYRDVFVVEGLPPIRDELEKYARQILVERNLEGPLQWP